MNLLAYMSQICHLYVTLLKFIDNAILSLLSKMINFTEINPTPWDCTRDLVVAL